MRSNERLQRILAIRQLGGAHGAAMACASPQSYPVMWTDLRLFALTFAGGFLFTSIFIA
jgi:hypothetical protein